MADAIGAGQKKVETSIVSTSATYPKRTEVVVCPYITSTASRNNKPRSFPGIEAETPIPRPPFAQKHSRTGCLVLYAALFTHPVKTIFLHLHPPMLARRRQGGFSLALVAVNLYNQTHYNNRQTSCRQ
jgi:hypothetical protein